MELNEAIRRVFVQHWRLIALTTVACIAIATLLSVRQSATYTASTTFVLDAADPTSSAESTVIGDTAQAIATSPAQINAALTAANLTDRNLTQVARDVSVTPLGASGVLKLSVQEDSPTDARALANALAARVISTRNEIDNARIKQVFASLDNRIAGVNKQILAQNAAIANLNRQLSLHPTGQEAANLQLKVNSLTQTRDLTVQQKGVLQSEESSLLATYATRPQAQFISHARQPGRADASAAIPDIALGALLGLVLGTGLAALIETLRPRFLGGDVLARELEMAHLGTIPATAGDASSGWSPEPIALVLRLAAERAGVRNVSLLATERQSDLGVVAKRIESACNRAGQNAPEPEPEPEPAHASYVGAVYTPSGVEHPERLGAASAPSLRVRPFGISYTSSANGAGTGIAVVSAASLTRQQIVELRHLLSVMPAPVLGLITQEASSSSPWSVQRWWAAQGIGSKPSEPS
jgi:capsular polysaccharide biosynthesis protein